MKNDKALISAILSLISGIFYIAFSLIFFYAITANEFSVGEDASEKVGFIFVAILILPITAITVIPSGLFGGLWQISRSIIYFFQAFNDKKSKTWVLVIGIILKILIGIVAAFGTVMFAALSDYLPYWLPITEISVFFVAIIISFIAIGFEFAAKSIKN